MVQVCTPCNRSFAAIAHLQQHNRDKHHNSQTKVPPVRPQAQPPQPQVQKKSEPVPAPTASVSEATTCEYCHASFTSLRDLEQHTTASHSWRCTKCPALPPFKNGTAWQIHFDAVHAAAAQSVRDTKGKKVATPINEGNINGQRFGVNRDAGAEARGVATQPGLPSSDLANVKNSIIGSPPSEASTSSVNEERDTSSASDDKVESQRTSPNSEGQTVSFDERDPLSPKGPTLNLLVEIDPEPRRGRDETTYEIASDTWSPTMTISSIGADQREGDYDIDVFPSHSLEPLNGSSLQKGGDITVPPRGPEPGEGDTRALSGAIVAGNDSRYEPDLQRQNGLDGATQSNAKERCEGARSDSPTSTTSFSSSRDTGTYTNQGDRPHDPSPSRARRSSRTGSPSDSVHFECRICGSDPTPTSNLTATHCGHLFCYECIAAEVLRVSRCPVCKNVLALYCLFKLDVRS